MDLQAALPTFVSESRDLLADMERALLEIGQTADRRGAVNAVFRAAHTIKGSAGLFGFEHMVAFAHALRSLELSAADYPGAVVRE